MIMILVMMLMPMMMIMVHHFIDLMIDCMTFNFHYVMNMMIKIQTQVNEEVIQQWLALVQRKSKVFHRWQESIFSKVKVKVKVARK